MFKGTSTTSGYKMMTGAAAFKVLGFNPTINQIESWTSRSYPLDVNYDLKEMNGRFVRPLHIWLKSEEAGVIDKIVFYIGTHDNISQSGSIQFVNDLGQFSYAKSEEELRLRSPNINKVRPAKEGEYQLFTFIQRFIGYKSNSKDANFLEEAEANNITAEAIYNNNLNGLNALLEHYGERRSIGLLLEVRPYKKMTENGEIDAYRQQISMKPDTFMTLWDGKVGQYQHDYIARKVEDGEKSGYPLSNNLFTIKLQEFAINNCFNKPVENPKPAVNFDDLPF